MSRSRSLLSILSDPHSHDSLKNKQTALKAKQVLQQVPSVQKLEQTKPDEQKTELDLTNLSMQDAKQILTLRKNQSQLNKNMSDYEQSQLMKLQKQILSYGDGYAQPNVSERTSDLLHDDTFIIHPNDPTNIEISSKKKNKLLVFPKISQRGTTQENEQNSLLDSSLLVSPKPIQNSQNRQIRSVTEYNSREKQWPGKFPLYSKNIDKINLSCLYLRFKQECINKTDEVINVTNDYKQLASPHKIYKQLSQQPSSSNLMNSKRASSRQDLPPLLKQLKDPFATIAQFNPSSRRIGVAEFQTDFSQQEVAQDQKVKNLQKNLYNQLIQQKLKLNDSKKQFFNPDKRSQGQQLRSNEKQDNNNQFISVLNQSNFMKGGNLLPQLLNSKQEKIPDGAAALMVENEVNQNDLSPQTDRISKINKIMAMKIKKNKKLRQSNSLSQIESSKNVIYYIGNSIKEIDKSRSISQYIDQLKNLNENIKKELQQQLQLNQPQKFSKKSQKKGGENVVQFLNKSDQPFYNLSYYKIDALTNSLQKVHKNPQQTLHQELDQNLHYDLQNTFSQPPLPIHQSEKPYQGQPKSETEENKPVIPNEESYDKNNQSGEKLPLDKQKQRNGLREQKQSLRGSKSSDQLRNKPKKEVEKIPQKQTQEQSQDGNQQKNIKSNPKSSKQQQLNVIGSNHFSSSKGLERFDNNITKLLSLYPANVTHSDKKDTSTLIQQAYNTHSGQFDIQENSNSFQTPFNSISNDQKISQSERKCYTDYGYSEESQLQNDKLYEQLSKQQELLDDLDHQKKIAMKYVQSGRVKAKLFDNFSSSKKQLRFATDTDEVIEEEDLSFEQLRSKKFNGEFNDSLYQDQFVKNFFSKGNKQTLNNSIMSLKNLNL